jgi:drug/metabolite transporter (DMT)-like permease
MFVCGGPVYVAGITTSAITLALIMAMSPLVVLLFSLMMRLEKVNLWQVIGMLVALAGAVLVITRGQTSGSHGSVAVGDLLVVCAMLAWAGYSLVQNRIGAGVSFLARVGMFAAAGALFSLPSQSTRSGMSLRPCSTAKPPPPICSPALCRGCLPIRPIPGSPRPSACSPPR